MKATVTLVLLCACAALVVAEEGAYPTKWDHLNVDNILANDRLRKSYIECMLDEKPCSPEGIELKKRIPDALKTACAKCSDKQREGIKKAVKYLVEKEPEAWKKLVAKYDPDGTSSKKFKGMLKDILV